MAQLNSNTPMNPAPKSDTTPQARTGVVALASLLAALAIAAGAYYYYLNEGESGSTTVSAPQSTTSDTKTVAITPSNTEAPPSSTQPMTSQPKASTDESRAAATTSSTPAVRAPSAKARHIAKASKPARATEPRERLATLATHPQPSYPLQALRGGQQGTVLVLAQVNVDGQVTDARVIRPSGSRILDRAAPNEVRQWKFEPALHNGRPVVASVEVPVSYRLNRY